MHKLILVSKIYLDTDVQWTSASKLNFRNCMRQNQCFTNLLGTLIMTNVCSCRSPPMQFPHACNGFKFRGNCCEIALMWMPQNTFDDNSTLVQAMVGCRQSTSHYWSQFWSGSMSPCSMIRHGVYRSKHEICCMCTHATYFVLRAIYTCGCACVRACVCVCVNVTPAFVSYVHEIILKAMAPENYFADRGWKLDKGILHSDLCFRLYLPY